MTLRVGRSSLETTWIFISPRDLSKRKTNCKSWRIAPMRKAKRNRFLNLEKTKLKNVLIKIFLYIQKVEKLTEARKQEQE